ncbi:MAG TPA: hypothetical protein VGW33_01310, partial [Terriglobia bacterium]|nr:hypothetical protein [Terriglobia bacterium]
MRATGSARGTKNRLAAVLLSVAMACLTATAMFGASPNQRQDGRRKNAFASDAVSQFSPVLNLGSLSALNQRSSVNLALGGRDAGAVFFNPGRAGTINNRIGGLSLATPRAQAPPTRSNPPPPATNDNFTNGGNTGLWSTAANWSAGLPNSGDDVLITGTGTASAVTEDINATINNLTLGSGNGLNTNTNIQLTVDGSSISNAGSIVVNGGAATNSFLFLGNSMTLSGTGTLTLSTTTSGGGNTFLEDSVSGITLTNSSTIQGEGVVGNGGTMGLTNSGTVD